ncbi:hypothetical protein IQ266_19780 [filamentous cyanobacterium LEGE 11480]|uniref:Uncharacterized protein n=1 Tax=Romeriopsis navalis LEGE 11480 TaxID=2777977 RepID=A0A928Z3Y5_9CYAN|nr:hypothetical protein [Romeriopsis navalis]MBE9031981.1 hypothetical protein [Romeriopsis navalis LEGE 11480]
MKLPKQVKPVERYKAISIGKRVHHLQGLYKPQTVFDLSDFNFLPDLDRRNILFGLEHGANYNDPMQYLSAPSFCGCHLLSGQSMLACISQCGVF